MKDYFNYSIKKVLEPEINPEKCTIQMVKEPLNTPDGLLENEYCDLIKLNKEDYESESAFLSAVDFYETHYNDLIDKRKVG